MFASKISQTLSIPVEGAEPVSVTIQKLSRRSLDAARLAKQRQIASVAKDMGAEMVQAYEARNAKDAANKILDPAEARFNGYDVETVLVNGIREWTADVSVAAGVPDLDEDSSEILFRAIIVLSVPTEAEAEVAQGKS